jgi:excisionase family DNA binding protein
MARFLNMAEAAEHLGNVSAETLYRLAREGHLPVRRIGRRLVISETRLDEWADDTGDVRAVMFPGVALKRGES